MSAWPFDDLQMFGFDLIVADPPWEFELYSEAGEKKSARAHYDTMPTADIAAMPVGHLASDNCLLALWTCGWGIPAALEVMGAWGFKYQSEVCWLKTTRHGKTSMGTGYRVRTQHEPILLGTVGNPKHKPFRSTFTGRARGHSVKPDEFYDIAGRLMPAARKLDLFARGPRQGWAVWGNEADKFTEAADKERSAVTKGVRNGRQAIDGAAGEEVRPLGGLFGAASAADPGEAL